MAMDRQNIEEIEMLAARIKEESVGTVAELLVRLRAINGELDMAWDGPSRQAFIASYGDWIDQLEKFSNTLDNVHQYLWSVTTNFRDLNASAGQTTPRATPPQ